MSDIFFSTPANETSRVVNKSWTPNDGLKKTPFPKQMLLIYLDPAQEHKQLGFFGDAAPGQIR